MRPANARDSPDQAQAAAREPGRRGASFRL